MYNKEKQPARLAFVGFQFGFFPLIYLKNARGFVVQNEGNDIYDRNPDSTGATFYNNKCSFVEWFFYARLCQTDSLTLQAH